MIRAVVYAVLTLSVSLLGSTGASTSWDWPVADPHPIVRPYIAPETPYSAGHRGIDIDVSAVSGAGNSVGDDSSRSTEVRAPADGVVHFAGIVVDRPVLSIRHLGGLISSYEPVTTTLTRGDTVTRGEIIGEVQTGHCTRLCLHFGTRLNGAYVSPLNYLSETPRAVLLPTRNRE